MVPFNRDRLACRVRIVDDSVHLVRLRVVRIVMHVGPEYAVVVANLVIHSGSVEVFGHDLQTGEYESANVWIAPRRNFAILVCVNQGGQTASKATDEAVGAMIGVGTADGLGGSVGTAGGVGMA